MCVCVCGGALNYLYPEKTSSYMKSSMHVFIAPVSYQSLQSIAACCFSMFFHQEAKRSRNERRSGWPPIPVISSRIEAELADKNVPLYGQ